MVNPRAPFRAVARPSGRWDSVGLGYGTRWDWVGRSARPGWDSTVKSCPRPRRGARLHPEHDELTDQACRHHAQNHKSLRRPSASLGAPTVAITTWPPPSARRAAGISGRIGGHSLRVGSARELAADGASPGELQQAGGWRPPTTASSQAGGITTTRRRCPSIAATDARTDVDVRPVTCKPASSAA